MKGLLAGIVFIIVIAFAGFFYRNTFEHPIVPPVAQVACPADAKLCPDGTGVGRSGASCTFAPCALPNYENTELGVSFVIPNGYVENKNALTGDTTLKAVFEKKIGTTTDSVISVRLYPISSGQSATSTILSHTQFETSGINATSLKQFTTKTLEKGTYYCVVVERFEAQVHTECYLPRETNVLRLEILEKNIMNWTDAGLKVEKLPEHSIFYSLLSTLTHS